MLGSKGGWIDRLSLKIFNQSSIYSGRDPIENKRKRGMTGLFNLQKERRGCLSAAQQQRKHISTRRQIVEEEEVRLCIVFYLYQGTNCLKEPSTDRKGNELL